MFGFGVIGGRQSDRKEAEKTARDMSPRERKDYERKMKQAESDREWDKLMDLDSLGFFD